MSVAAADEIADWLAQRTLVVDIARHGLPHRHPFNLAVAVGLWAGNHRLGLGLGLLEVEHADAISRGGVVSTPQGLRPVFVVADVAPQHPAPHRVALPALPAEVH